jgi:16S rRNA (uracil1498-N3)-methyltransferase
MHRIFQNLVLNANSNVHLDSAASHYVARVLRLKVQDEITLFNGAGGEYRAIITEVKKTQVCVKLLQFIDREVEAETKVTLMQSVTRGEKMDFIVQKAVELGVSKIVPLVSERCNVNLSAERSVKRLAHWQAIAVSACEQCGRNRIPQISAPIAFAQALQSCQDALRFILSPEATEKLIPLKVPALTILIGPEGGFSNNEIAQAVTHQFKPIQMGARILRVETASIAALAILQAY